MASIKKTQLTRTVNLLKEIRAFLARSQSESNPLMKVRANWLRDEISGVLVDLEPKHAP
jgi:hypothetical protein